MALGSGLDILFEDNAFESKDIKTLRMSEIEPNKSQPRTVFDEENIKGLAESIKEHGLIQPIVVRPLPNGITYQIIAGERRWRACKLLKMEEVPVIIRETDELEAAQLAIVENVQRADLNPVEEAMAYRALMDKYGMTQDRLAEVMGKSRPYIANLTRLLSLPEEALTALSNGEISVGHAKVLLSIEDKDSLIYALNTIISEKLSVRQTEKLAAELSKENVEKETVSRNVKNYYTEMELSLKERLGRSVKISGKDGEKGKITISFNDKDDLSRIANQLIIMESDGDSQCPVTD
ncbi:MAG: ParB/RepB/Spo0J family partition protein [Oscillospiraceae bacterium]|nr:ParB/RepB/Spo0J family partition protein [Oscillospiraceae bacterium]MCI7498316.1 ParB/RepB/Spo0J family partition protein [Oscillospiraceae bacterium]MDD7278938.1 ParB/RepB/Spo0J family partition protein [Oscillospiraceae bacterium]MDY2864191.1 ParB/RepB/Spo0J family partition protein [Oscillospiraceae bacterium]